jgi:hypothetical protein
MVVVVVLGGLCMPYAPWVCYINPKPPKCALTYLGDLAADRAGFWAVDVNVNVNASARSPLTGGFYLFLELLNYCK